jgi:protoporphyrinogen oxidase
VTAAAGRVTNLYFFGGIDPEKINADWAAQRIKSLSLGKVILDMLKLSGKSQQTSLISQFHYPRMGAGEMYTAMADKIRESGSEISCNSKVLEIKTKENRVTEIVVEKDGKKETIIADFVISSMPLEELVLSLDSTDKELSSAAEDLTYRSLVTVDLMFDKPVPVTDHWIYLNSPDVKAGRMNLFQNWSKDMMPSENHACISLEYFCNESDPEWSATDEELFKIANEDIAKIDFMRGLIPVDQTVVRYGKAYPCYFGNYMQDLDIIKEGLGKFKNLLPVGRYGQFRYNNMDHSIETGLLAARVIMGEKLNVWAVNEEAEYHEEGEKI